MAFWFFDNKVASDRYETLLENGWKPYNASKYAIFFEKLSEDVEEGMSYGSIDKEGVVRWLNQRKEVLSG